MILVLNLFKAGIERDREVMVVISQAEGNMRHYPLSLIFVDTGNMKLEVENVPNSAQQDQM